MSSEAHELVTEVVPVDSLKPYGKNPRIGDIGAISVSLEANGQYRPIVVNRRDNSILAGNHTWKAAKALGWDTIAATFVDVDDAQARRIVLVDNRSNDIASYDEHALIDLLESIVADDGLEGLLGTGFDGDDLDDLIEGLDDDEPGGVEETGEVGQVLEMGDVTLDRPDIDVSDGDVWVLDGRHLLFVTNLFTGHQAWASELKEDDYFLPYPEPYVTVLKAADEHRLIMVVPNTYLAAHIIHRHILIRGPKSAAKR